MAAAWVGRAATPHTGKMFAKGARAGGGGKEKTNKLPFWRTDEVTAPSTEKYRLTCGGEAQDRFGSAQARSDD